jgi:uncharacterized membrane protein
VDLYRDERAEAVKPMTASVKSESSKPAVTDAAMKWCIGVGLVLFFSMAWMKYHYFNGDTNDLTVFAYAFAGAMRGQFLPVYFAPGSLLGCHVNWVILAGLPLFAVWRSFYALLFFQSFMLTIAAWPFYLLAKHVLQNHRAALLAGIAFLIFPTIVSQHVNQIHDDQFGLPFLMLATYCFVTGRFRGFVIGMVLTCFGKESLTLTTAAFGIFALIERRSWRWVVTPIVFSVLYLAFAIFLLRHVFTGLGAPVWEAAYHLGAYGKTYGEIFNTFLTRPGFVMQVVFTPEKVGYLGKLFLPVLYILPFLSPAIVLSLPNLLLNMFVPNTAFTVIPWHYNIILGATLLVASLFGIKRLADWFPRYAGKLLLGLPAVMVGLSLIGTQFWYHSQEYQPKPYQVTLEHVLTIIPPDAAVLCPTPMLAQFSTQPKVNSAYSVLVIDKKPERLTNYDFIILDGNWGAYEAIGQMQLVKLFNENPPLQQRFQTVFHENNVYVLQQMR